MRFPASLSLLVALAVAIYLMLPLSAIALSSDRDKNESIVMKAEPESHLLIDAGIKAIEQRFGVIISRQDTAECIAAGTLSARRAGVRDPQLNELSSLEYALSHSPPAYQNHKRGRNSTLEIRFLKSRLYFERASSWCLDSKKRPIILIEADYETSGIPLEQLLLHELAHDALYRMGLDEEDQLNWKPAREVGWLPYFNPETGQRGWLMRSRESERYFYRLTTYTDAWVRCDGNGRPLTKCGAAVKRFGEAYTLTDKEVAAIALIAPATDYFDSPIEMIAEGLMLLRSSSSGRSKLLAASPRLYSFLKAMDQSELDLAFGSGKMTRTIDGVITPVSKRLCAELASRPPAAPSSPGEAGLLPPSQFLKSDFITYEETPALMPGLTN